MNPAEVDPGIIAAQEREQRLNIENQRREAIAQIIVDQRVPSYEMLEDARSFVADLRQNGQFDNAGKLVEEPGLSEVHEQDLDDIEEYFQYDKWLLNDEEKELAYDLINLNKSFKRKDPATGKAEIVTAGPTNWDKMQILEKKSPALARAIDAQIGSMRTLDKLEKFTAISDDCKAIYYLDLKIRKQNPGIQAGNVTPRSAIESDERDMISNLNGWLKSNKLDANAINKAIAALDNLPAGTSFAEENKSGLSPKQKEAILELFKMVPKGPSKNMDITRSERISRAKNDPFEQGRKWLHGNSRTPSPKRYKIETKAKLKAYKAGQQAAEDAKKTIDPAMPLTPQEREKRTSDSIRAARDAEIERGNDRLKKGSFFNRTEYGRTKYGVAFGTQETHGSFAHRAEVYGNLPEALEKLQYVMETNRTRLEQLNNDEQLRNFGSLEGRLLNAVTKDRSELQPLPEAAVPTWNMSEAQFEHLLGQIGTEYDRLLANAKSQKSPGDKLSNLEIESIHINSQLNVATELVKDWFENQGMGMSDGTVFNKAVLETVRTFHAAADKYMEAPTPKPNIASPPTPEADNKVEVSFTKEVLTEISRKITEAIKDGVRTHKTKERIDLTTKLEDTVFASIKAKAIEHVSKTEVARRFGLSDPADIEAAHNILTTELKKLRPAKAKR